MQVGTIIVALTRHSVAVRRMRSIMTYRRRMNVRDSSHGHGGRETHDVHFPKHL